MNSKCIWCGKIIKIPNRTYCCMQHRTLSAMARNVQKRTCEGCGQEYHADRKAQKYCCLECARRANIPSGTKTGGGWIAPGMEE